MDPPCFLLSSPPSNPKTQEKSPNRPPTPLSLIFSFLSFFILPLLFPSFSFLHPPNHHTHDDCYSHHQWCHCLRATTSQQSPSTSAITPLPLATSYPLLSLSLSLFHTIPTTPTPPPHHEHHHHHPWWSSPQVAIVTSTPTTPSLDHDTHSFLCYFKSLKNDMSSLLSSFTSSPCIVWRLTYCLLGFGFCL